jgi:hypothetical protein
MNVTPVLPAGIGDAVVDVVDVGDVADAVDAPMLTELSTYKGPVAFKVPLGVKVTVFVSAARKATSVETVPLALTEALMDVEAPEVDAWYLLMCTPVACALAST